MKTNSYSATNHSEKVKILKGLNESELRREVIIPLLSKMGYKSSIEYHGVNEKGKDIICYDYNKLDEIDYLSVVAKTTDISGDVSTDRSLREMIYQVEQSFNTRFDDIYSMKRVFINEVWIVTTGRMTSGAQESVIDHLRKNNLDKRVKIIQDDRLVDLIDRHYETFWNMSSATKESVIIQRDRLILYMEKLLREFGADKSTIETIKNELLNSSREPIILQPKEGYSINSASAYFINITSIDPQFDELIYSYACGFIKDQFTRTKKEFRYALHDIEEVMYKAEKILENDNPIKFIEAFDTSHLNRDYPFHNNYSSSDFFNAFSALSEGIDDIKSFKNFLSELKLLEWYKSLASSLNNNKTEIERRLDSSTEPEITIQFSIDSDNLKIIDQIISDDIKFTVRKNKFKITRRFDQEYTNQLTIDELMDFAHLQLREYIEKSFNYQNWQEKQMEK